MQLCLLFRVRSMTQHTHTLFPFRLTDQGVCIFLVGWLLIWAVGNQNERTRDKRALALALALDRPLARPLARPFAERGVTVFATPIESRLDLSDTH